MRKKIMCMFLTCLLTMALVGPVSALAAEEASPMEKGQSEITPMPRADKYLYYYRIHNGVYQYRIWNATDGYWVTDWISVPDYPVP